MTANCPRFVSIRPARHAIAWMPVCNSLGISSLRLTLRLKGAGYRRYSSMPEHINPNFNRHWFRHVLVAYSPGGITPFPFLVWLGVSKDLLVTPYQIGMVRQMLLESCSTDWAFVQRLVDDLNQQLDEDAVFLTEKLELQYWVRSCCEYVKWYARVETYFSITAEDLLDPLAVVFRPDRKDQLFMKENMVGSGVPVLRFRSYETGPIT